MKWIVRQETKYLELDHDAFAIPGAITFFSPASPEEGFYDDRELRPEGVAEILTRLDEVYTMIKRWNNARAE